MHPRGLLALLRHHDAAVRTLTLRRRGRPDKAAIFVDSSPVFETDAGFRGSLLARYADSGSPLLSGYLIGESQLHGRAAALDAQVGDGHVVLIGFRPEWRGQPFGTFRVLFNSVLYSR
jgi:ribosomal protein S18 acetylase RimI-like enzyme